MSENIKLHISELEDDLRDVIADMESELNSSDDPEMLIYELVDSYIPTYYWETVNYASNDVSLATATPDEAFYGDTPTACDLINAVIYERLIKAGFDEYSKQGV